MHESPPFDGPSANRGGEIRCRGEAETFEQAKPARLLATSCHRGEAETLSRRSLRTTPFAWRYMHSPAYTCIQAHFVSFTCIQLRSFLLILLQLRLQF